MLFVMEGCIFIFIGVFVVGIFVIVIYEFIGIVCEVVVGVNGIFNFCGFCVGGFYRIIVDLD